MAKANGHKFGQMIGELLELAIIEKVKPLCNDYDMYLDYKHPRAARKNRKKVTWEDVNGNRHDLDLVIEINGTEDKIGNPKAFIETAWRRTDKHAKNKVQEISAAILPIVKKYNKFSPFYGVVLAGEFNANSLRQLESEGFKILHFSYDSVIESFASVGLNIQWDDSTDDEVIAEYIEFLSNASKKTVDEIIEKLFDLNRSKLSSFIEELKECFSREIESIRIFTLYGDIVDVTSVDKAIEYINNQNIDNTVIDQLLGYEIYIKYNNGDRIEVKFKEKRNALKFLREI